MDINKIPLVIVLRKSLQQGALLLPAYSCAASKHAFTQPQLFACLVYKYYRRLTYRETAEELAMSSELRQLLGITKTPHYSTLSKFSTRVLTEERFAQALSFLLKDARPQVKLAAMDSSGLGKSTASTYYR